MSEKKHERGTCEFSAIHRETLHYFEDQTCVNWHSCEPVASPQSTMPDAEMQTRILDAAYAQQKRMESAAQPAAGTTPQAERPDDTVRFRERLKKISFLITGNDYAFLSENPEIEESLKVYVENVTEARAVAPGETPKAAKLMVTRGGEIHEECPDCRGECSPYKPAPVETPKLGTCKRNSDEHTFNTHGPLFPCVSFVPTPVQTRLTAEQFVLDWWKQNNREAIQYTSLVEMCEAFRDKSESKLRQDFQSWLKKFEDGELDSAEVIRLTEERDTAMAHVKAETEIREAAEKDAKGLREEIERLKREAECCNCDEPRTVDGDTCTYCGKRV